jgi:hypothetical protein
VAPSLAKLQSEQASNGQSNSSFGGSQLAGLQAAGQREAADYAANWGQQNFANSISARNSYLQGAQLALNSIGGANQALGGFIGSMGGTTICSSEKRLFFIADVLSRSSSLGSRLSAVNFSLVLQSGALQ